jgi:transposase-like protein
MNSDEGQRIAALMMASSGLLVRDIAVAMKVSDRQVQQWLQDSVNDVGERERHKGDPNKPGMAAYRDGE